MKKGDFFSLFIPFLIFIFFSLVFFFPLIKDFRTKTVSQIDGLSIAWNLNTVIKNFPAPPEKLFEGNGYFPYPHSAALTDPFLTDALLSGPVKKITDEPLAVYNFALILSQILFLLFSYLFFLKIGEDRILALIFSLILSFCRIRLHYYFAGHLQMLSLYWLPLSGYLLIFFAQTKKARYLYGYFLCLGFQTINSFLGGYFILFLFVGLVLFNEAFKKAFRNTKNVFYHLALGGLLSAIIIFPIAGQYLRVARFYQFSRTVRETIHFSLSPEQIFSPTIFNWSIYLPFLGSSILLIQMQKGGKAGKKKDKSSQGWLVLAILALVIALGPALHWQGKTIKLNLFTYQIPFPLPYLVLYFLLPGFKAFRTPSRWILVFVFMIAAASVVNLKTILKSVSKKQKVLILAIISILFLSDFQVNNRYYEFPLITDYPPVYYWLKDQPGQAILEIPIYYWGDFENSHLATRQMLYSLFHQKKIFVGYGSFSPPEWEEEVVFLRREVPSPPAIEKIKDSSFDYLVVHLDELKQFWGKGFDQKYEILASSKHLKEVYNNGNDQVFAF